ncbi:RWD domain-containing protein 1 [Sarcoptes scabiei]|uniref:RWD domain-containing protein 1 n=1 Tax=Sarcoptes scabiei TaxID=52283 RepID=A0A834R335_SARSC|nr:RWD domain-containing protein 1 [Sarcoptes scabiei]
MSHAEEQSDEVEALKAIYPSEIAFFESKNVQHKFSIKINSENFSDDPYQLELLFGLPDDYPEISPEFEIISSTHLTESDQNQIMEILKNVVQDNLGSVMIFALITRAIEWINQLRDFRIEEQRKEEERIQKELEELEQKKFEGTRVTVESFILWKLKFDAEMAALNQKDLKSDSTKLTGKEMFMRDKNLIDSDLCFGENDDLNVKVDESLFVNDQLSDEDDPDFLLDQDTDEDD